MRSKFTSTGLIDVSDIMLDQNNYRLGPLDNQIDCINIMFEEFGSKMVKIAGHIAQNGLSPKPIVISKDRRRRWVVRDGNRRITAIKLLNNPAEAPEQYQKIFRNLKNNAVPGMIPEKIECLTSDEHTIIEYRKLEHMGPQDGIGQVDWDPRAKGNMQADVDGITTYPLARAICDYLEKKGITDAKNVSISNMQRLFQDTEVSKRLGIDWNEQQLRFLAKEDEIFNILKVIITDFTRKENRLMVKDIYHPEDRRKYINDFFENRGFKELTPLGRPIVPNSGGQTTSGSTGAPKNPARTKASWDRTRVIPRHAGLSAPDTETKLNSIVVELSKKINVREAPIAAAVLVRLVLERCAEHYAKVNGITFKPTDDLHLRIGKVAEKMRELGVINKNQLNQLKRMSDIKYLMSTATLNSWVHNADDIPQPREVCTFWDSIHFFLVECWK